MDTMLSGQIRPRFTNFPAICRKKIRCFVLRPIDQIEKNTEARERNIITMNRKISFIFIEFNKRSTSNGIGIATRNTFIQGI